MILYTILGLFCGIKNVNEFAKSCKFSSTAFVKWCHVSRRPDLVVKCIFSICIVDLGYEYKHNHFVKRNGIQLSPIC